MVDGNECKDAFGSGGNVDLFICAGGRGNDAVCPGDSGGPFTCYDNDIGSYYLAGVVSQGPDKCEQAAGDAFTKLALYYDWVIANMGNN